MTRQAVHQIAAVLGLLPWLAIAGLIVVTITRAVRSGRGRA